VLPGQRPMRAAGSWPAALRQRPMARATTRRMKCDSGSGVVTYRWRAAAGGEVAEEGVQRCSGPARGRRRRCGGSNSVVGTGVREARRGDVGSAIGRRAAVGTDTRGPDSAFKARRGRVAAMRRRRADRRAWRCKRWLTGRSLMSAIFELKFTPERK
jgi:hypothetical protein